jgi:hypothetical protein
MKAVGLIVLGFGCLLLTSCGSSKPQDLIVGKWQLVTDDPSVKVVNEFTSDGVYKGATTRKYKFVDDKTIKFYDEGGGPEATYTVSVTSNELTLTSGDNRVEKFKRVQ